MSLSNSSMRPCKLKRHFISRHGGPGVNGQDIKSLEIKRLRHDKNKILTEFVSTIKSKPLVLASYHIA